MPIHDWPRVAASVFHDFHHSWVYEIQRALNAGLLPEDYYALAEQQPMGSEPNIWAPQAVRPSVDSPVPAPAGPTDRRPLSPPRARFTARTASECSRRKMSSVVVRHVRDHRMVALIEIVTPGNKAAPCAFRAFLARICDLLGHRIHLLLIDLFPPGRRDPHGLHAAIWAELVDGDAFAPPADKPLTLVAYESDLAIAAYVEPVAVGDVLPEMPLLLEPGGAVNLPLETTYQAARAAAEPFAPGLRPSGQA